MAMQKGSDMIKIKHIICCGIVLCAVWAITATSVAAQSYAIGHMSVAYEDSSRNNRQISTEIYYPATVEGDDTPIAEPPANTGFPVIAFGHGYLMTVDTYAHIWEALVPDGFIVLLPNTESNLFPSHLDFGKDQAFIIAALHAEGQNPDSPFHEKLSSTAAVMGHSMGGGASFLAVEHYDGITAIANLAAAETTPSAIAAAMEITIPALLFGGTLDCVTPPDVHQMPMFDALSSDCKTFLNVIGGSHCQFGEPNFLCELGETACPDPDITYDEQHAVVFDFLTPWLKYQLLGDSNGWATFQALLQDDPRVQVQHMCDETGLSQQPDSRPGMIHLQQNYPNPFQPPTFIPFQLNRPSRVVLEIYNTAGQRVRTLVDHNETAGFKSVQWDGRNNVGEPAASGMYLYRLKIGQTIETRRMLLLR